VTPDFEWTRKDWGAEQLEVYIKLDHLNALQECNEGNNEFVVPYTVYAADQPMADLTVQGHMSFDTANLVNRNVNIRGTIVNRGNAAAGPFWVEFICDDDRDAHTKLTHRVRMNQSITGGGSAPLNTQIKWSTPGMKVCIMTLDKDDEVVESAESNNEYIGITVRVDEQPPVR
jgi:subtilase family serine protease